MRTWFVVVCWKEGADDLEPGDDEMSNGATFI
jgi:hypothetical protein